ncbi:MAG: alanine racemase [Clostridia bacterium]|nr:alanine racemase [Clostridia bacterium]
MTYGRAWAEIDLSAVDNNVKNVFSLLSGSTKILGVVKADAYGHGAVEIAEVLLKRGVYMLAVATIEEACVLREHFPSARILMLSGFTEANAQQAVKNDIHIAVINMASALALSNAAAKAGVTAAIHIKIDSGMNRVGFYYDSPEAINEIVRIASLPNIYVEGIFTHFSKADEKDLTYTHMQFERFVKAVSELESRGMRFELKHCCNSAATIMLPQMHLNMVRPGIIIYGHYPSEEINKSLISLTSAMTLKSTVSNIKEVPSGAPISYGGRYTTALPMKIGTLSIGYADGYMRNLSNKASIIINNTRAKILGTICMDQCMFDATNVQNVCVGDCALMFGRSGSLSLPVEELADISGTINYEILCAIGKRVPRVYIHGSARGKTCI